MRLRFVVLAIFLCFGGRPTGAHAVPLEGLYEATVSGDSTEVGRAPAATEALRQVTIRVTGRGSAAADPALQSLYADAPKYVLTYRSVAPGLVAVAFDPALVEAALTRLSQRLWGRERPQLLVVMEGSVTALAAARRELQVAAQLRGIPLLYAETRAETPVAVREGQPEALKSAARTFGTEGVLLVRATANGLSAVWTGPAGEGSATGGAAEVMEAMADRLGAALAVSASDSGRLLVVVHGVDDFAAYAGVLSQLASMPAVQQVSVDAVSASTLKLRISGSLDGQAFRKSTRDTGRFEVADGGTREVELVYHP